MTEPATVVQTLQDLGITRNEAEIYLATLKESQGGPVSGYRVAQSIGKDPANLSKTLASLEVLGAVRTIQEKPRLYVPVDPAEFTNKLIADMESNRQQVLKHLANINSNKQKGIPLALNNLKQALTKASELMGQCRRELLLFADVQILEKMGTDLEDLAARPEVTIRFIGIESFNLKGMEETIISIPVGFADPQPVPWLQMIVDRQIWLTASFSAAGVDKQPCGWWSDDSSLALIMGAGLCAAADGQATGSPALSQIPNEECSSENKLNKSPIQMNEEPESFSNQESISTERPQKPEDPETIPPLTTPAPHLANPSKQEDDDDLQFLIRHDEDE